MKPNKKLNKKPNKKTYYVNPKEFLQLYPDNMFKTFGKNHNRLYKIKESINKLSDDELNSIADSIYCIPEEERTLTTVFKKAIFKKPSLLFDVIKVFSGF